MIVNFQKQNERNQWYHWDLLLTLFVSSSLLAIVARLASCDISGNDEIEPENERRGERPLFRMISSRNLRVKMFDAARIDSTDSCRSSDLCGPK